MQLVLAGSDLTQAASCAQEGPDGAGTSVKPCKDAMHPTRCEVGGRQEAHAPRTGACCSSVACPAA